MKLLIVSREQSGDRAFGLGKTVGKIADGLRECGSSVEYITVENWRDDERKTYERLIKIGGFISRFFGFADFVMPALAERFLQGMIAARAHLECGYTHIWFQDPWIAVGFLCRMSMTFGAQKCAWGVSEHGLGSFTQAVILDGFALDDKWTGLLLRVEKSVLARAAFVWTPSVAAMRALTRDMGYADTPSHWQVIGYGKPSIKKWEKRAARESLGWQEDMIYVLAVGRIAPVKRFDMVIKACALAQIQAPNIQLVIVGGKPNESLADAAMKCGLARTPICVFADSVDVYLSGADIYVSGCEFESFGMANMEAVCAGLACVVAGGGGAGEIVSYGGWLCNADADSLSKAIAQVATDEATRAFWSDAALARACEYAQWDDVVSVYERALIGVGA
jgi:glycosyltransferase involved in cell wall biosynthesis